MKKNVLILFVLLAAACTPEEQTLKHIFEGKFILGAAVNESQIVGKDVRGDSVLIRHFAAIEPENCMKSGEIMPAFGQYDWTLADKYVDFGTTNGLAVYGHCLIWHSQCTPDFCYDPDGNLISPELLKERMKQHITTVVTRYKGRIKGWDVVNEAILDNGQMRNTQFYNTIGPEYIRLAFQFAHEADPNAELYYNDYSMDNPAKRQTVVNIIRDLKAHGCRIDGVGMQSHVSFSTNLAEYEKSIETFAAEGVKVMVTELDLSVLPWPSGNYGAAVETNFEYQKSMNPYTDGLPADKAKEQTDFFVKLFKIYLKHADVIDRVTFWGLTDGDSWKNGWPMAGRTDYPLAIDRNYNPKPFVEEIIKLAK